MKPHIVTCLLLASMSCSDSKLTHGVPLMVTVRGENRNPLAGVSILLDGMGAGETDTQGQLNTLLRGPEGSEIAVKVACPSGRTVRGTESRRIPIRYLRPISGDTSRSAAMDVHFECVGTTRRVVLLVRSEGGEGLSVRAMGKNILTLDEDGVAQTVIEGAPGEEVEVSIDTTPNPLLRPASPTRRLVIPETSQILLFDQKFESKKEQNPRNRFRRNPIRPRRI